MESVPRCFGRRGRSGTVAQVEYNETDIVAEVRVEMGSASARLDADTDGMYKDLIAILDRLQRGRIPIVRGGTVRWDGLGRKLDQSWRTPGRSGRLLREAKAQVE